MHRKLQWVKIQIFGKVPVAAAGREIKENGADVNLGVEMMLLVKEAGSVRTQSTTSSLLGAALSAASAQLHFDLLRRVSAGVNINYRRAASPEK